MADRNNFDYAGYAADNGYDWDDNLNGNQEARDLIYKEAVTRTNDILHKQSGRGSSKYDKRQTLLDTEKIYGDARWAYGIDKERTPEEESALLSKQAFGKYLQESGALPDEDPELYFDNYRKELQRNDWANPLTSKLPADVINERLENALGNTSRAGDLFPKEPVNVVADGLTAEQGDAVKNTVQQQESDSSFLDRAANVYGSTPHGMLAKTAYDQLSGIFDGDNEEGGTVERIGSALSRSVDADESGAAAAAIFDAEDTYTTQDVTYEDGRPVVTESDPIALDPELLERNQAAAAQRLSTSLLSQKDNPVDPKVAALLQTGEASDAISMLAEDPSILPILLAEGGYDMGEEIVAQLAGTAVGAVSPVPGGAVAGGAAAAGAAAYTNSYNSFLSQEVQKALQERSLENTPQNIITLMNDEAFVSTAKQQAEDSSKILAAAAAASSVVGGALTASALAKVATKLGLRPVAEGGRVVFQRYSTGAVVGAAAVGATASTAIDVAGEIGAKAVTDEKLTGGELVATIAGGVAGSTLDVAPPLASAVTDPGGAAQVRVGEKFRSEDGQGLTVVGGDDTNVSLQNTTGELSQVKGRDLIAGFTPTRKLPAVYEGGTVYDPDGRAYTIDESDGEQVRMVTQDDQTTRDFTKEEVSQFFSTIPPIPFEEATVEQAAATRTETPPPFVGPTELEGPPEQTANAAAGYDVIRKHVVDLSSGDTRMAFPPNYFRAIDDELGDVSLQDIVSAVGADLTDDRVSSNNMLVDGFVSARVIELDEYGRYVPVSGGNTEVRTNIAAIANVAKAESISAVPTPTTPAVAPTVTDVTGIRGEVVTYQGSTGLLVQRNDGLYVLSQDGDILVEGGESGRSAEDLGLSVAPEPDFEAAYASATQGVTTDFDNNTFTARGNTYTYVRANSGPDGVTRSVTATDAGGQTVTFTDPTIAFEVEAQKIEFELGQYNATDIDNAYQATIPEATSTGTDTAASAGTTTPSAEPVAAISREEIETDPDVNYTLSVDDAAFRTENAAANVLVAREIDGEVVPVEGGFAIRHNPPAVEPGPVVEDVDNPFSSPLALVGEYVDYQGIEGILTKETDGLYVYGENGKTIIEGGLSGRTAQDLGITRRRINFDEVFAQNPQYEDVITDFRTNEILLDGETLTYVRAESDDQGITVAIVANHPQDGEVRITDSDVVNEIESQKIEFELGETYDSEQQWAAIRQADPDSAVRPLVEESEPTEAGSTTAPQESAGQLTEPAATGRVGNVPVAEGPDGNFRDSRYNTGIVYDPSQVEVDEFVPEDVAQVDTAALPQEATVVVGEDPIEVTLTDDNQYIDAEGTFYPPERIMADIVPAAQVTAPTPVPNSINAIPQAGTTSRTTYDAAVYNGFDDTEKLVWNAIQRQTAPKPKAEDFIGLDDAGIERFRNMAILFGGTNVQNLTPETIDSAIRNIQALHRVAPDQVAVAPGNLSIGATRKKHVADVDELSRADLIAEVRSGAQEFGVKIGPQTVAKLKERAALMRLVRDLPEAHPHKPTHNGIAKARRELGLNTEPYQATTIDRTGIPSITAALRPPAATNSKIRALVDKPISVNLGDDVNHMQPSTLDQFEDAGYDVTPVIDEQGNIVHVALEKDGRKVNIVSLGDMNPDSIRDRTYKVYIGGTISGSTVKGGQEIKSLGGNKKFTVPGDLVAINSPDDITAAVAVLNAGKLPTDDTYATVGARNTSDHPTPYLEPYTINDGRGGTIEVLFKPEGETVLTRDGATVTGTPDSPVGISTELAERTAHQKLQEDIDTIKFTAQLRDGVAPQQPLTMDINDVQLERKIDMIDQPHRYAPDGKGVMMDTGDSTVGVRFVGAADMNADELRRITEASSFVAAPEQALFDVREDGTPLNETNGVGLVNYTKQDVQAFVNSAFPEHIANMIELHDQPSNPASQLGAWGFFAFDYQGNGPRIIIDVTPGKRDWNSVLSTISEEVAHFSFDSWTTGRSQAFMRKFYDRAWELYGGDAINDMPHYVESNDMDPTNPTDQHKWILLNEYFSKQGTSLADFSDSKVSAPGGLTRAEVDELSKLSADTLDNLTIDFEDIQNMDSREFATLILKAQTRAINPRPSMFTLRDTDSVVTVRPTPFGRITKYRVNTEEAEAHTNYRSWIQRSDGSGLGNAAKAWRFFWARNNTYQNSITGREIQRTVTANVRIDAAATSRSLQLAFQTSRRAQAVLREAGLPEAIRGEGYVATFQRGGITNERHLALAKLADEQMKMAQHAPFQGAEKIRNEALAHVELMRSLGEAREIPAADLGRMMATIEQEARIYRADYSHVRYKAHNAPEDKANLERMNAYLRGTDVEGKTVYDDYLAASAEKARLLSLPDQDTAEVRTAIYAQEQLMKPYTRLEALYTSFAYKLRRPKSKLKDRDADIVQLMKNELTDLTTEQEYGLGKAGIGTMDSVSRRRKLDPDAGSNTSDYHMRKFLDPITDPLEVAVYTQAQQANVLRQMQANRKLAEQLLDLGAADLANGHTDIDSGSNQFTQSQKGTILQFIKIDSLVETEITRMLALQSVTHTGIARTISQGIGTIKQFATVLGVRALTNIIGIPYMLLGHGHLFRPIQVARGTGVAVKAWRRRNQDQASVARDYSQDLITEMTENDLIGTGLERAVIDITDQSSLIEGVAKLVFRAWQEIPVIGLSEERAINWNAHVSAGWKWAQDFYAFSDEAPKIMSYAINRGLMEQKYSALLKREDYDTAAAYQADLNKRIVAEAIDRTRREQTDWSSVPDFAKRVAQSNFRVFAADFFLHNFQAAKVAAETVRIGKEDVAELKRATDAGHDEYAASLRGMIARRAAGASIAAYGVGWTATTGWTFGSMVANTVMAGAVEAYEELTGEEVEDVASLEQVRHMSLASAFLPFADSSKYEPYATKVDKWTWVLRADASISPFDSFSPRPLPNVNPDRLEQLLRGTRRMLLSDNGTLATDMVGAYLGVDWLGDKPEVHEYLNADHKNMIKDFAVKSFTPQLAKAVYEAATGKSATTGKALDQGFAALTLAGVKTKTLDARDLMSSVGGEINREIRNRRHTKTFIDQLRTGNESFDGAKDIHAMVLKDRKQNWVLANRYRAFMQSVHGAGYNRKEILDNMTVRRSPGKPETGTGWLPDSTAKKMWNGVNVFDDSSIKKLRKALEDTNDADVTPRFPQEFKDRAVKNLEAAIALYSQKLNNQ